MSFINLKQIEHTIKQNKEKAVAEEKFEQKKEERDRFAVKKLPTSFGTFRSPKVHFKPSVNTDVNDRHLTEWKNGFNQITTNLFTNYCKRYGCNEEKLKKEIEKSKDISKVVNSYMSYLEDIPDIGKLGLTLIEKAIISKQ